MTSWALFELKGERNGFGGDDQRDGELVATEDGEGREQEGRNFLFIRICFHTVRLTTKNVYLLGYFR